MTVTNQGVSVPPFNQAFPSEGDMDAEQRSFFAMWVEQWNRGNPLPVHGNISYLCCFAYNLLALETSEAIACLSQLVQAYPDENRFLEYCKIWISKCYVILGEYRKALDVYPPISIGTCATARTDDVLSLKLQTGEHINGRDVLTLIGPNVTEWGKAHLEEVELYVDINIGAHEKHEGVNLLEKWKATSRHIPYNVFTLGMNPNPWCSPAIPCVLFSRNEEVLRFVRDKTREAENCVREEMNIPRVGEGWVGETELYYAIRDTLAETTVLQHASPPWLGRQHLDVFIPEYSVALEYQGAQHDEAVEYFGGEAAYLATKKRDARKKRLCSENGVRLIEVRPGYDLQDVIETVRQLRTADNEVS